MEFCLGCRYIICMLKEVLGKVDENRIDCLEECLVLVKIKFGRIGK